MADLSLDPDLEFSYKTLRLADPMSNEVEKPAVNVSTKAELLLRCLDFIFFRSKMVLFLVQQHSLKDCIC